VIAPIGYSEYAITWDGTIKAKFHHASADFAYQQSPDGTAELLDGGSILTQSGEHPGISSEVNGHSPHVAWTDTGAICWTEFTSTSPSWAAAASIANADGSGLKSMAINDEPFATIACTSDSILEVVISHSGSKPQVGLATYRLSNGTTTFEPVQANWGLWVRYQASHDGRYVLTFADGSDKSLRWSVFDLQRHLSVLNLDGDGVGLSWNARIAIENIMSGVGAQAKPIGTRAIDVTTGKTIWSSNAVYGGVVARPNSDDVYLSPGHKTLFKGVQYSNGSGGVIVHPDGSSISVPNPPN
jgi:hypothetical protein